MVLEMLDGQLEDIRKMSEEQFVEAFEVLRERTRDWTEFPTKLITEDSRQLFVLRCALGLTQKEFGRIRGVRKTHIGRLESGKKRIIHTKPAQRWVTKIEGIVAERKPSFDTAVAKFIDYKRFTGALESPKIIEPISHLTEDELFGLFVKAKETTKDFTDFTPQAIMKYSKTLLIFRLVKGLSQKEFSQLIDLHPRSLSSIERGKDIIGMGLATKLSKLVDRLFKESKITADFDTVLYHFKIFKTLSKLDLEKAIDHGLEFAKRQKLSETEHEIKDLLESRGIKFSIHPIVQGLKRKLSMDFSIPSEDSPQFVIETFSAGSGSKPLGQILRRVWETDHRFHMVKSKDPLLKTIMCVRFERDVPLQRIKERIELELLSTDILLVDEEIRKLPEILRE